MLLMFKRIVALVDNANEYGVTPGHAVGSNKGDDQLMPIETDESQRVERPQINVRLPKEVHRIITMWSLMSGESVQKIVSDVLTPWAIAKAPEVRSSLAQELESLDAAVGNGGEPEPKEPRNKRKIANDRN